MSTLKTSNITDGTNTASTEQLCKGSAKAWFCANTTTSPITILDAFNVSSLTDLGVGLYTVNFTKAMPNTNYVFAGSGKTRTANDFSLLVDQKNTDPKELTSCGIRTQVNGSGQALMDSAALGVVFFGA